ncbi:MAG: hypothetical protein QXF14_04695, partial [Candidatus Woesearchaeota archaeon]
FLSVIVYLEKSIGSTFAIKALGALSASTLLDAKPTPIKQVSWLFEKASKHRSSNAHFPTRGFILGAHFIYLLIFPQTYYLR